MDFITKSPGLFHLCEKVFLELDYYNLLKCEDVNPQWRNILRASDRPKSSLILKNPWFWLKKCSEMDFLPPNIKDEWIKVMQNLENPKFTVHYLKKIYELSLSLSLSYKLDFHRLYFICSPFYMGMFQKLCKPKRKWDSCFFTGWNCCKISKSEAMEKNPEIASKNLELVKTYLEFVDSSIVDKQIPNTLRSPIDVCLFNKEVELMRILARYSNNLNTPNERGQVPLVEACFFGFLEIAKILAPLTRDPLSPTSKTCLVPSSKRQMLYIGNNYNRRIIS